MRALRMMKLIVLPVMMMVLFTAVLPVAAQTEPVEANAGTGITLFILALVLGVIFAVAVVAAVSLGVIGIGYSTVQSEE